MAIKTIEYTVDIAGVTPAAEQFAGTQGDHRVAEITFKISDTLYSAITSASESGKALYRFDIYDGEGGIWSSDATELSGNTVCIELEERYTRYGGKLTVYLVITVLSEDDDTEIELYSFPVRLRLNNRPEGIYQDSENYESITSLAEIAKNNARAAESSNQELQEFAAEIEEKLKNGDFDGVGIQSTEIVNDELVITYTDGTSQNIGNVKGDKGDTGPQGEKGDAGADGKDAIIDQTYNAESENAQSGVAVAEAVNCRIPKPTPSSAPFLSVVTVERMDVNDNTLNDTAFSTKFIDDLSGYSKPEVLYAGGFLVQRDGIGNLWTGTPVDDWDCANKKYVDVAVSKISGLKITVVAELPQTGETDTLYFVPATNSQEQNLYDEYIYADGAWEKIGSASVEVDLTDYVKNTDYATNIKGGVVRTSNTYCVRDIGNGVLASTSITYEKYQALSPYAFISKGTLDNVLAAKLGDIESLLGGI